MNRKIMFAITIIALAVILLMTACSKEPPNEVVTTEAADKNTVAPDTAATDTADTNATDLNHAVSDATDTAVTNPAVTDIAVTNPAVPDATDTEEPGILQIINSEGISGLELPCRINLYETASEAMDNPIEIEKDDTNNNLVLLWHDGTSMTLYYISAAHVIMEDRFVGYSEYGKRSGDIVTLHCNLDYTGIAVYKVVLESGENYFAIDVK